MPSFCFYFVCMYFILFFFILNLLFRSITNYFLFRCSCFKTGSMYDYHLWVTVMLTKTYRVFFYVCFLFCFSGRLSLGYPFHFLASVSLFLSFRLDRSNNLTRVLRIVIDNYHYTNAIISFSSTALLT